MKILFCGDVVGRSGREAVKKYVPELKRIANLDAVIINGENAQHGSGASAKTCEELFKNGADVITMGNHVWDCREMLSYIEKAPRVLRPMNFMETVPGRGFTVFPTPKGSILVVNAMGQVFMHPQLDNPFPLFDRLLKTHAIGTHNIRAIVVDFHAEATSEKMALGYYLDGRVSLVVGTHTHVPTADEQILNKGTAYMTDAGMCGDYHSIIGFPINAIPSRYLKKVPMTKKPEPTEGEGTLSGVYVETNDKTGLAQKVAPVRLGGLLPETSPFS